jgi:Xaa-Pro dipeptidase
MRVTRRHWIGAVGAATAAAALPPPPLEGAIAAPPLPPPLKPEAFRERQSKLKAAAKARGMDALLVTPSANLSYAANLSMGRSERLTALLLFAAGPAVLVTPFFEEDNVRRDAVVDDVATWKEDEDPIALAARLLAKASVVGIEGSTAYETVSRLLAAAPVRAPEATPVFDALRMVKSEDEQAFIREAGRRTSIAIEGTHKRMSRGMTESEVSEILEQEFQKLGVHGGGLVQFGPSSALPHGGPGDRRLARGDVVLIDCGCRVRGYTSDITRTVAYGTPSDEVRKVYATVDRAQIAGIEALKAGVSGESVDRAARKVIEDAGYGASFTHRLGHGLGLDGHEPPYLVRGNAAPLSAGNTVTIEPGIYLPGKFGVRIEDDYAARDGAVPGSLSTRPGELVVLSP